MDEIARLGLNEIGESGIQISSQRVFSFPVHAHGYCEMTLYQPFDGTVFVNQSRIEMGGPGRTAILVTQADVHRISVRDDKDSHYIKISFDESLLPSAADTVLTGPVYLTSMGEDSVAVRIFEELLDNREDTLYCAMLAGVLVMFLSKNGVRPEGIPGGKCGELAIKTARILNERFSERLTLGSVAKELAVSPQYLSVVFSKEMGIGFSEYLIEIRLRRAAELLKETKMSVTEICFQCGYGNLSHFLRSFKRTFGTTPFRYRNVQ